MGMIPRIIRAAADSLSSAQAANALDIDGDDARQTAMTPAGVRVTVELGDWIIKGAADDFALWQARRLRGALRAGVSAERHHFKRT
jgi:hypothetical protein